MGDWLCPELDDSWVSRTERPVSLAVALLNACLDSSTFSAFFRRVLRYQTVGFSPETVGRSLPETVGRSLCSDTLLSVLVHGCCQKNPQSGSNFNLSIAVPECRDESNVKIGRKMSSEGDG
jgi:hypothetical protein